VLNALLAVLLSLQVSDTSVRLTGFVVASGSGNSAKPQLRLAVPLTTKTGPVNALTLPGDLKQWSWYMNRYMEAVGRVLPPATLDSPRLREVRPPGQARKDVDPSYTQHATVTLAVVPNRIVWRDSAGHPTGVMAAAYYTVLNKGNTQLVFLFSSADILCLAVSHAGTGDAQWREAWRPPRPIDRIDVQMASTVRYLTLIPEIAAPTPGRYTARASLCGVPDYEVTAEFEVAEQRP
jgi:hypothetical protein